MAFKSESSGNNNNYQPQFFLSLNSDKMEKILDQKKHYETEKNRCEKWLINIRAKFDKLRDVQKLIYDKYLINAEKCCALESDKKPIPAALAAELKKSRELLEETTAELIEVHESRKEEIAKNEEALKSIEAELTIINREIAALQRSLLIVPIEEKLESLLEDIWLTEQTRFSVARSST